MLQNDEINRLITRKYFQLEAHVNTFSPINRANQIINNNSHNSFIDLSLSFNKAFLYLIL